MNEEQLYRRCPKCTGKRVSSYAGLRVVSYEDAAGMIVTQSCDCQTGFVPVSPIRSWREALVDRQKLIEAIDGARYGGLRSGPSEPRIFGFGFADYEHAPTERIADAVRAALRATPEPGWEAVVDVVHTLVEHMQGDVEYEHKLRVALAELRYAIVPLALLPPESERPS